MKRWCIAGVLAAVMVGLPVAGAQTEEEFRSPPESARPMTWWHWMQGNVSREGITADLEAMKHAGLGGALIFHVGQLPIDGDVKFASQQWWDLMRFATEEADRLGLKLGAHNCPGWSASGGPWIKVEQSMQKVVWSETRIAGPADYAAHLPRPTVDKRWDYYRDIAVLAMPDSPSIAPDQILDLTASMDPQGKLTWRAPAGNWLVLRIGHTTTGQHNAPAPPGAAGLECDKMNPDAVRAHFAAYPAKLLANAGKLAGKTFSMIEVDSYEAGDQNWTPKLREEFQHRRGYDLLKWLPILAGRTVGSQDQSRRFQDDMRQTIAECFAEYYYGTMRDLVHGTPGMQYVVEPYTGPFDTITVGGTADMVMGEFWINGWYSIAPVASAAHVHGQTIVAAEAFTGSPNAAQWRQDPYALKGPGDKAFALGVNKLVLHTTAHQPWPNAKPGMTMGWWGTHFGRTQTWWEQSPAWISYLTRCQYLLQQGRPVADALTLDHDREIDGYKADRCDATLIQQLQAKDGRLVLPSGMTYRALELPDSREMPLPLARKIRQLVADGALVLGPAPERASGLQDYPTADREVQTIAREVWGPGNANRRFGAGRAISGMDVPAALTRANCPPDVLVRNQAYNSAILWTHRRTPTADIYFISNQRSSPTALWTSFRIAGRIPELWHADTGQIQLAPLWQPRDGRTDVLLQLPPTGSIFVVFRSPGEPTDPIVDIARDNASILTQNLILPDLVIRKAIYGVLDDPKRQVDVTAALQRRMREGSPLIADNSLIGDPAPMVVKEMRLTYTTRGEDRTITLTEGDLIDFDQAQATIPDATLSATPGATELIASHPGTYTLTHASGKKVQLTIADLPSTISPTAPWQLSFPANSGAPSSVTLPNLISWPDHPDRGIRYFSGTATYRTQLTLPADALRPDLTWSLDLGTVKNLAEITVNGRPLGILWKPPMIADVTTALHPGANDVEIKVTNLWPNRLIGDEQEPDDCQWGNVQYWDAGPRKTAVGRPLTQVPDWLRAGTPRPSTHRLTFTTWKFYTTGSPLLPSGLLGPVRLVPAKHILLPTRP